MGTILPARIVSLDVTAFGCGREQNIMAKKTGAAAPVIIPNAS
jgi:hypothetical protein